MTHSSQDILRRPVGYTRGGLPIYLLLPSARPGHPEMALKTAEIVGLSHTEMLKGK